MPYKDPEKQAAYFRTYDLKRRESKRAYNRTYHAAHREEANAKRRKRYQENRPQELARSRVGYRANAEERKAYARTYRKANPEKIRQWNAAWVATNPERKRLQDVATKKAWRKTHPEEAKIRAVALAARRRARKRNAPVNDFTAQQWKEMKAHYKYRCVYCGKKTVALTQDHITPLAKGGSHTKHNIVPACSSCNVRKSAGPAPTPVQPLLL